MNWHEFYKNRINSTYQNYFEYRYHPFLNAVLHKCNGGTIIDAGCGIGSVSKYLRKYRRDTLGFDMCPDMVKLSKENVPDGRFIQGDLLTGPVTTNLTVTHGVLEHFTDEQIQGVLERYPNSIHYVPLQGYPEQSFGDERLLPMEYWVERFNLKEYDTFNNGLDLYFLIDKHKLK